MALPFPAKDEDVLKLGDRSSPVVFEKQRESSLRGLTVTSASRRSVHSEQLFELGGSLRLGTSSRGSKQIENHSQLNLRDVVVVQRSFSRGQLQVMGSWVGELRSNKSAVLGPVPIDLAADRLPFAQERAQSARDSAAQRLQVDAMLKLAFQFPGDNDPYEQYREEVRLVGVVDGVLPGAETSPSTSQIQGATVVLAHLKYVAPPAPRPDVNNRSDVVKEKPIANEETE